MVVSRRLLVALALLATVAGYFLGRGIRGS